MRSVFVVAMLLAVALAPLAGAGTNADCRGQSRVAFQNDDVRVWFHGMKDFFKVFDTNGSDDEGRHYDYHAGAIVERDASNATIASMNLQRAFPQTSSCSVSETDESVDMTLVVTDNLDAERAIATVAMVFHFNKSSQGVKFDLDVQQWPWHEGGEALAFQFALDAANMNIEPASNGAGFRDDNGTAHGYVEWAPNATVTYEDGSQQTANVTASESGDAHHLDVTLDFDNVPAGYVALAYDLWMGAGDYVVVGGILVGLAPVEQLLPKGALSAVRALL